MITLIGIGDDGPDGLSPRARTALDAAEVVVASPRLLAMIPATGAERHAWPTPFDPMAADLRRWRDRRVVIAATGDPMWYGVGATLAAHFAPGEVEIVPAPSAFSLAAARLLWPLHAVETLSLHGRPANAVERYIQPGARLIALTGAAGAPAEIARRLCARGFGESPVTVLEHLGGSAERILSFPAQDIGDQSFSDFHVVAVECRAGAHATILPRAPGLPDEAFKHDGQLTKREVRAVTVASLAPRDGALLWDVGAGCGSVAIEWLRFTHHARAIAFEREPSRVDLIAANADRLGTPELAVVEGEAPACLAGHPAPDAVFIGGAASEPAVFAACWQALKPAGTLVANAVTVDGEGHLGRLHAAHGGDLVRLDVAAVAALGGRRVLRPRIGVLQWRVVKP